jgi:hypothetical protein
VLVGCGGRALAWPPARVRQALLAGAAGRPVRAVFHGGAGGADRLISQTAQALGWPLLERPALWARHGRGAGPVRNQCMVAEAGALAAGLGGVLVVVAFPGGRGTSSCVRAAQRWARAGGGRVPVRIEWHR